MSTTLRNLATVLAASGVLLGCGGQLTPSEEARRAALGLEWAIGKSVQLAFDGFNAAHNDSIPEQSASGEASGSLILSGQLGAAATAEPVMNLVITMIDYSDGAIRIADDTISVTYATPVDVALQPSLEVTLLNAPNGTFTGTLAGPFQVAGDVTGDVSVDLTVSGMMEDVGKGVVEPILGTTAVAGTATLGDGEYTFRFDI